MSSEVLQMKVNNVPEVLSVQDIKQLIPHRYPMLMVDKVEVQQVGEAGVGIKNVTANEEYFQGHFPDNPIMPGVLIVEAMAQTAGVIVTHAQKSDETEKMVYFMSIEEAKFRKPVFPGDTLEFYVTKEQSRMNVWKFKGVAKVGDAVHAEAKFTAMIVDKK